MKFIRSQARQRRQDRRQTSPTSSTASALPSTSEQSSPQSQSIATPRSSFPSTNTSVSNPNTSSRSSSSNDFIQQNPRYASLWLQKCLLPKRLTPSTLTGASPHYLNPDCYPYPSMSDSVDRVFVHALHTVKRLPRTGSSRPPERDRLLLYGLYKQATEGDVAGLNILPPHRQAQQPNPTNGTGPASNTINKEEVAEREKWDAWRANGGMGKTEAKRAYIERLIATMRRYAMSTVEARELVGELEFVWDQIREGGGTTSRGGSGNGGSGSPDNNGSGSIGGGGGARRRRREHEGEEMGMEDSAAAGANARGTNGMMRTMSGGLRVLRPMSEGDDALDNDDHHHHQHHHHQEDDSEEDEEEDEFQDPNPDPIPTSFNNNNNNNRAIIQSSSTTDFDVRNRKWRARIELALSKLSVEIAALREQQQTQSRRRHLRISGGVLAWTRWLLLATLKHLAFDAVVLLVLVVWSRRKAGDRDRDRDQRVERGLKLLYSWVREHLQMGRWRVMKVMPHALGQRAAEML